MKKKEKQFGRIIGVDLGDKKYVVCVTDKNGDILGQWGPDCDLRRHGLKLAESGGKAAKKKAVTAIARKLAVLMLAMWQRQSDYEPLKNASKNEGASEKLVAAA